VAGRHAGGPFLAHRVDRKAGGDDAETPHKPARLSRRLRAQRPRPARGGGPGRGGAAVRAGTAGGAREGRGGVGPPAADVPPDVQAPTASRAGAPPVPAPATEPRRIVNARTATGLGRSCCEDVRDRPARLPGMWRSPAAACDHRSVNTDYPPGRNQMIRLDTLAPARALRKRARLSCKRPDGQGLGHGLGQGRCGEPDPSDHRLAGAGGDLGLRELVPRKA
jgi:hypothetical protein